jgi:hypothetical protein
MHKNRLEELHHESIQEFEKYMDSKNPVNQEDHEKLTKAKEEWQAAWNKFLEALIVLERIEI